MKIATHTRFDPSRPWGQRYTTTVRVLDGNYLVGVTLPGRLGRAEAIRQAANLLRPDHSWVFVRDLERAAGGEVKNSVD